MAQKIFTTDSWNEFTAGMIDLSEKVKSTNIAYGTCSTAATTVEKVITISGDYNWKLEIGSIIVVKFSATNTAKNPTFNVNGTGAKSVWYNTALITTTSSTLGYAGTANRPMMFMYDGTQYVFISWAYDTNSTYSNASLGQGYGTCETAESTTAKVVTLSSYSATTGGIVAVKFTYAVPANATMNINSKGAKNIFYRGAAITAGIIKAGDIGVFIYDGTQYHLLTVDRDEDTTYTLGSFGVTATASELNVLDGITATTTELNYVDGVTSNIQTQIDNITNGTKTVSKATSATSATYATTATKAGSATSATNASTAEYAKNSGTATYAQNIPSHTHPNATTTTAGFMSETDKHKLEMTNVAFGTCDTAAATAAKVVTISGNTNWKLETGAMITVKFTNTNTASNATLNVNGTGAKSIYYNNAVYTSNSSYAGYAKRSITYQYDGTYWVFISWSYDTNSDTKVSQTLDTSAANYPLLLGYSNNATTTATVTNTIRRANNMYANPSTGEITATTFIGALSGTASYATNAGSANKATSATSATYATTATSAGSASKATSATSATYATTATKAGTATKATSATYASTANYSKTSGIEITQEAYNALVNAGTVDPNAIYYIIDGNEYVSGWRIEQVTVLPSDAASKTHTMYVVG